MSNLNVQNIGDDRYAYDSRLIAEILGVEHGEWMLNVVKKYLSEIEEDFGQVRFQNGPLHRGQGYALLTKDQVTCLTIYSGNTDQVRAAKRILVKAFSEAESLNCQVADPLIGDLLRSLTLSIRRGSS